MTDKKRIAVFDLDGTLTTKDTFVQFAFFSRGWLRTLFVFGCYCPLIILMKLRICDNGKVKQRIFSSLYKGMDINQFRQLGRVFSNRIDTFTNYDTLAKLYNHQRNGDMIIVNTASINEWVCPWCEKNNINKVIATEVEIIDNKLSGRFSTPNCYGKEKVFRLYKELNDLSIYNITVYGDSRGDNEIMAIADQKYWI